jgi:Uma2 family endonuclease
MSTLTAPQVTDLEAFVHEYGPVELQQTWSKAAFVALAERYPDLRMELTPTGKIDILPPIKRGGSRRQSHINFLLCIWNEQNGNGEVHSSNGTYDLPDNSIRMPDASWISPERLAVKLDDEEAYITIVPDFVVEIRSATDRVSRLQEKVLDTWLANGVRLAWLIDPYEEKAYVYRAGSTEPEVIEGFDNNVLFGEDVMPECSLPLVEMKRRGG